MQHALAVQSPLPSPPGDIAVNTNQGQVNLLGTTLSIVCSENQAYMIS